jgi:hypothetical protein
MIVVLGAVSGCLAALLQIGAAPALFGGQTEAAVLPVAVIVALGAWRGLHAGGPAALAAALTLGVASELRAGWFVLALLPAAASLAWLVTASMSRRLLLIPLVAALAALSYDGVLLLAAGRPLAIADDGGAAAQAAIASAVLALLLAALAWPLRPRPPRGWFA